MREREKRIPVNWRMAGGCTSPSMRDFRDSPCFIACMLSELELLGLEVGERCSCPGGESGLLGLGKSNG
jgi:hypothetical protein